MPNVCGLLSGFQKERIISCGLKFSPDVGRIEKHWLSRANIMKLHFVTLILEFGRSSDANFWIGKWLAKHLVLRNLIYDLNGFLIIVCHMCTQIKS